MLYILIITLVLLIPALTIHERDSIHKKDWQGANDERNTIPSFREGTRGTLFLAILAQMQCTSKAQWGSQWEPSRRSKDGRREWSIQHRTVRPPHQWGFGVAFLCGDDRNRKGRDAREHAWGPGPRTNSPVSFSLGERRRTPTSSSSGQNFPLGSRPRLVWSGLVSSSTHAGREL